LRIAQRLDPVVFGDPAGVRLGSLQLGQARLQLRQCRPEPVASEFGVGRRSPGGWIEYRRVERAGAGLGSGLLGGSDAGLNLPDQCRHFSGRHIGAQRLRDPLLQPAPRIDPPAR